jgi:hypothetical protein
VCFLGPDGILQREMWDGAAWTNSFPTCGTAWQRGTAAVSRPGSGIVDVFVVGSDGAVWHSAP